METAVALSEEAAYRATLGTSRVEDHGGELVVIPDFTRAMAADLDFLESHAEAPDPRDFSPFLEPGSAAWGEFFSRRKVVERVMDDGTCLASVTSNFVDVVDKREFRDPYAGPGPRPKRYEIAALLSDLSLIDKFEVKGSFRAEMRNLAAVDTARAAKRFQEHVRQYEGCERAVVLPGKYAHSWKAARETLKLQAARFPPTSVAVDAMFVGDKIFMYGEDGVRDGWRVFGPESVASLVRLVHRMVEHASCESVMFALGPELTVLDIDIHDGFEVLCPARERHAGSHDELPLSFSPRVASFLSAQGRDRLRELASACGVLAVDGLDCATAVRVSSKYVLVNSHVVNDGGRMTCDGEVVLPHKLLSRDLWLARCRGNDVVWPLREPCAGEDVVLCYRRHDAIQYGGPVRVLSVGADVIALEKSDCMLPGVSGAAVVALSDFSLLGVYDGVAIQRGLAATYTPEMYSEMCDMSDRDADSRASASADTLGGIVERMKRHGYGKVVGTAMSSLLPLYSSGEHVGMGFSLNGKLYTACDPQPAPLSVGETGQPLVFEGFSKGVYRTEYAGLPPPPAVSRPPAYGDEVFVVGRDDEGHYCSRDTGRVTHVGLSAHVFQVAGLDGQALPLVGGLVLSRRDAAVVGVCGAACVDRRGKPIFDCFAFPAREVASAAQEQPEAVIARVFPFLNPSTWGEGVVEAVVSHASVASDASSGTQTGYAMVGDSAMRTVLWRDLLLKSATPTSGWQTVVQTLQSNSAQAAKCEQLGLSAALRVGGGLQVASGSKLYADLLEAVAGAVYLFEPAQRFESFCRVAGVLPVDTAVDET